MQPRLQVYRIMPIMNAQKTEQNTNVDESESCAPEVHEEDHTWNWKRLGPAGVLGLAWVAMPAIMGFVLLANLGTASDWLQQHESYGLFAYIAIFIVSAGFGFLPTYAQSILGGWVFGMWWGTGAALVGFTGASVLAYFLVRFVSKDKVEREIADHPKAKRIREVLIGQGFLKTLGIVTLLRVPPNSPFAITNLAMASAGVRLLPYTIGTAVGMAPRTIIAVWFAAAASSQARDLKSFVEEGPGLLVIIGGIVSMVIVLAIVGSIANKAIAQVIGIDDNSEQQCKSNSDKPVDSTGSSN